jgi:hypothetical protein
MIQNQKITLFLIPSGQKFRDRVNAERACPDGPIFEVQGEDWESVEFQEAKALLDASQERKKRAGGALKILRLDPTKPTPPAIREMLKSLAPSALGVLGRLNSSALEHVVAEAGEHHNHSDLAASINQGIRAIAAEQRRRTREQRRRDKSKVPEAGARPGRTRPSSSLKFC